MSPADPTSSQLPRSEETWQVVRLRLPLWMEPDDQSPFRPWCVLGVRLPSRAFLQDLTPEEAEPGADRIGEALAEAAGDLGFVPRRLQVAEAGLAADLRRSLSGHGFPDLQVEPVESLPELDEAVDALVRGLFEDDPGLLSGDGVTLNQVASFAEAAVSFVRAEPWRHLEEVDRIQVEAPEWGLARSACVLGWAGPERGMLFSPVSPAPREKPWLVHFVAPWMIPAHDLYLWEKHGFAVAGEEDFPRVARPTGDGERPDSRLLGLFEAVLRALAVTTEDEMDSGRWEKTVETGRGPVQLTLSLPDLLHPPEPDWGDDLGDLSDEEWLDDLLLEDGEEPVPTRSMADGVDDADHVDEAEETETIGSPVSPSSEMEAQKRVYQAWESLGRRRVALARQALALWPGCADAWTLLAERERDPERAVSLYSRAIEEAGRGIDAVFLEKHAGDFWSLPEARPYLSVRFGLAEALWEADRYEEAVAHFQELLRLDPRDHLGARSRLADALRRLDSDESPKKGRR